MTLELEKQIRQICTYYSELGEGTAGYNLYDHFVKLGRNVGFTDEQIDFLWDYFYVASVTPKSFTHDDNYKKK